MLGLGKIREQLRGAAHDAPIAFFEGLGKAVMVLPKGVSNFWDGFTPEEQATINKALRKAVIQFATSYVASGGKQASVKTTF